MTWLGRLAAAAVACLAVVLLGGSAAWAAYPPPAPYPTATDRGAVPTQWRCNETPAGLGGTPAFTECSVTAWATMAPWPTFSPPAPIPNPLPVVAAAPLAVSVPTPLPVVERSPVPASVSLSCGAGATASAAPSPEPSPEPSAAPTPVESRCLVTASIDQTQWIVLGLFLGALLLLAVTAFLRREGRSLR